MLKEITRNTPDKLIDIDRETRNGDVGENVVTNLSKYNNSAVRIQFC